jgi:hypothetical protein
VSDTAGQSPRRYSPGFCDPATLPEFQVIAAALRRGTKCSGLRTLVIVCSNDHRLAEVYGTGDRAVLLACGEAVRLHDLASLVFPTKTFFSDEPPSVPSPRRRTISVRCHCRRSVSIPVDWIKEQLAQGTKRAIWATPKRRRLI